MNTFLPRLARRAAPILRGICLPSAALLAAVVSPSAFAATATNDWSVEDVRFEEPVKAGAPIRVTNPLGDVQVRQLRDRKFFVTAAVQRRRNTPLPEFKIQRGDAVHLVVAAPATPAAPPVAHAVTGGVRADLAVFAPPGSALFVETAHGSIVSKGVKNDLAVRTNSGGVELFAGGWVDAVTKSGDIFVLFKTAQVPPRDMRLHSETGGIVVRLPRVANAVIDITTAGELSTDFSASVTRPADSHTKTARIRVSEGPSGTRGACSRFLQRVIHPFRHTPRIEIRTVTGAVKVIRCPPDWRGTQEDEP